VGVQSLRNDAALEALKARIADLEGVKPSQGAGAGPLSLDPEPGLLHEVFTDERRNAGATLGFALGQARGLLSKARPAVFFIQRQSEAQELGLPYGVGLESFGFASASLVLARVETAIELLWALEEALSSPAVAAVIADVGEAPKALDFTATRRLSLRAGATGGSAFILRYGRGREASAARRRWHLAPQISRPAPFDARAPGHPRWRVTLEKGPGAQGMSMVLDWTENGFERVETARTGRFAPEAAPFGARPAALGDRPARAG
jgi:protein ImuA